MNKEIKTYEEYVTYIKVRINEVMEKLYQFSQKENESGSGLIECSALAKLIMELGTISETLRPYTNNNIPTQHKLIDEWIEIIDIEKLDCLFLVSFLRYTFVARNGLKNWIDLRDKVAIKLDLSGKESKKILKGLL